MKKLLSLFGAVAMVIPITAMAFTASQSEVLPVNETISDNYYVAGSNPVINGNVNGDLVIAGGNVVVTGNVRDDIIVAGGTVILNGTVGDDVRVAGGNVEINGMIRGEVVAFAGEVKVGDNANIGGDFVISAGQLNLSSSARIGGEKKIDVPDPSEREQYKDSADQIAKFASAAFWTLTVLSLLSIIIAAAVGFYVFQKPIVRSVGDLYKGNTIWANLGIGLVFLFMAPIVSLIAFITGVGFWVGMILLVLYFLLIFEAIVFAGIIFGGLLMKTFKKTPKNKKMEINWLYVILGVVALHIVSLIPAIGWIISFFFFLTAIGTLLRMKWDLCRR
ncbi:hypothetical protein GF376_03515 [Candidatus Peregrinibacteria bacterium]|nr:hypothetical protein [Candidatus Peregrinibacteria bacterium]